MVRRRNNPHKAFMALNVVLVIAVFIVVLIFLYLSFRFQRNAEKIVTYEGHYIIEMTNDFAGQDLSVYVNDSLLINQIMPDSSLHVSVNKFAEESILMIVNNQSDTGTSFNLNPEGSKITVKKSEGIISITEDIQ